MALLRMHADPCRIVAFSPKKPAGARISASVGTGGRNKAADVRTVQELLNRVPAAEGGPAPPLVVDGFIGPKTIGAIQKFQRARLGFVDGRVDPGGPTITKLNGRTAAADFGMGGPTAVAGSSNPIADAFRLTMMTVSIPEAKSAVNKALATVQQAFNFVMLGGAGLTGKSDSFDVVDRHFLLKAIARDAALSNLQFMTTTLRRMKTILDNRTSVFGSEMFGANLFEADPHQDQTDPRVKAYVPKSSVERTDGLTPHKIYLCRGLDGQPQDRFTHILIHEMGHFVDDESPDREIVDHGYAFFDTLKGLPHEKRIHNADSYAIFAFENAFGKSRLSALFPRLRLS